LIALSEASPQIPDSPSRRDIERSTEAARIAGWRVWHIPQELPEGVEAEDALCHVPAQGRCVPGIWIGYIPLPSHYEAIYRASSNLNIRMLNTPSQFRLAEEFDRFYPLIADLTAISETATNLEECEAAARRIGYPVFLKGTIQSLKGSGLKSCIANNPDQLRQIAAALFSSGRKSLGTVVVRERIGLRHSRTGPGDFPFGREYRVFIYNGQVVGLGYYWEGEDKLKALLPDEQAQVLGLAVETSRRLGVPFVSVDVGQREDLGWIVIEVGDGQFSGLSQIPIHQFWARLSDAVIAEGEAGVQATSEDHADFLYDEKGLPR